ncbi:MAG: hypothetical protein ACC645_03555 [Pirellulales bacterium]
MTGPLQLLGESGEDAIVLDYPITAGSLAVDGGMGVSDQLTLRTGDSADSVTVRPAAVEILGSTTANYVNIDTLAIDTGKDNDVVTVAETHPGTTTVRTGLGDDQVTILATRSLLTVETNEGTDTVNVRSIGAETIIDLGEDDDTANVSSDAPANTGVLVGIAASLTILGNDGSNSLSVDDRGNTTPSSGTLSGDRITGLGMAGDITFESIADLDITLGSAGDVFTIEATDGSVDVTVDTRSGDDQVEVRSIGGGLNVKTGDGADTIDVKLGNSSVYNGLLTVDGGGRLGDTDVLNVDSQSPSALAGNLTSTALTGLGMLRGIRYSTIEELNIELGPGSNNFVIEGTHAELTNLSTRGGDDVVTVESLSGGTQIDTGAGLDTLNVRTIDAPLTVDTGADDDTVNVGTFSPDMGGTVNSINALLIVNGGAGDNDTLNVDDTGDTAANVLIVAGDHVGGLGMSEGIDYSSIEVLNLGLGSGSDIINIRGTAAGAETNIDTAGGDDRFYLSSDANVTVETAPTFDFLPGHLDGFLGPLVLNAGSGRHLLMVSDEAALIGDGSTMMPVRITDEEIDGLAPARITYVTDLLEGNFAEGITVWAGHGDDFIEVNRTHRRRIDPLMRTVTTLNTGLGDDQVDVNLDADVDGFFVLNTQGPHELGPGASDDDRVDGSDSTLPLIIFGGEGADSIVGGQADDILFGDWGRLTYFDGVSEATVLGNGGPGDRTDGVARSLGSAMTVDPALGGADLIDGGPGSDLIFGGRAGDVIDGGTDASRDIVVGDHGIAQFDSAQRLIELRTTNPTIGGDDTIRTGNGRDLVLGGFGNDFIDTGVRGVYDHGDVRILGLNFNADTNQGLITGTAGAVAAPNWNNLPGDDRTASGLIFSDGTPATGVSVDWGRERDDELRAATHVSHGQIDPDTQNERLFEGYLQASESHTLRVDIADLSPYFGSLNPYDVYVYVDADDDNPDAGGGSTQITDGRDTYFLDDSVGNTFRGTFVEATSTDATSPTTGNYVVFRDVTSGTLSIRLSANETLDSDRHPTISALQIVGGPDKDHLIVTGDMDEDVVLGDNGVARFIGDRLEVETTDHANVAVGVRSQEDVIITGDGADVVLGGNDDDRIDGGEGNDVLLGDNGRVMLLDASVIGLVGVDFEVESHDPNENEEEEDNDDGHDHNTFDPYAVPGIELLDDQIGGDDLLEGGKDDDLIYGQFGDDTFVFSGGGLGRDALVESEILNDLGDSLDFSQFVAPVRVEIRQRGTQTVNGEQYEGDVNSVITLLTEGAFENITGSAFADHLDGNDRDNTLIGLAGDDHMHGREGNDVLSGGDGDDELRGDHGQNLLIGGGGADELKGDGSNIRNHDGGNILIGGWTVYDEDIARMRQILDGAWASRFDNGDPYQDIVDDLVDNWLTPGVHVFDDQVEDDLHGKSHLRDVFFAHQDDDRDDGDNREEEDDDDDLHGERNDRVIVLL